jgi:CRP-like cAMP-binding protein
MPESSVCPFQKLCPDDVVLVKLPKGRTIFSADQQASFLYHLHEGVVKCVANADNGVEITTEIIFPPQFIGLAGFVGMYGDRHKLHVGEARAVTPVVYCKIRKEAVWGLLDDRPERTLIFDLICATVLQMASVAIAPLKKDASNRILHILKMLGRSIGKCNSDGQIYIEGLSQEDIASLANTTRPTVTRVLQKMQREGFIWIHRRQIVFQGQANEPAKWMLDPLYKSSVNPVL